MIQWADKVNGKAPAGKSDAADRMLDLLAEVLGTPRAEVRPNASFVDHGLSSLLAVRFVDRVNRAFDLRLGIDRLFAHPSPAAFAAHVAGLAPAVEPVPVVSVDGQEIAVIGLAGRFGPLADVAAFWQALVEGRSLIGPPPAGRWPGETSPQGAFLTGIEHFDADFFGVSPKEARAMDPQQRMFLEQAVLALENAGYGRRRVAGRRLAVMVGASASGYDRRLGLEDSATDAYGMTGNLNAMLAARVAYHLDARGPALVVDTACSSSLVAVDMACQALLRGDADMALAGGVSLFLDRDGFAMMDKAGMLSPQGRCRTFDAEADGIVLGEAVAAVVLKPLARALADGDRIDAVIRASVTNQDGRSNGITAPNPAAQADLLRAALGRAGLAPDAIGLIEAHGTGTPLGDPVEVSALTEVFGGAGRACALSSAKTVIGHASEAAGIVGLIKVVESLKHRLLPPHAGFAALNPRIDLGARFFIPTAATPWQSEAPRRAGISSFGLSGTNAHVIVEEAPPAAARPVMRRPSWLIALSAPDAAGVARRAADLAAWLGAQDVPPAMEDLAFTLLARDHHAWRMAFTAADVDGVLAGLAEGVARRAGPMGGDDDVSRYLSGTDEPWERLYPEGCPLPLPGTPFRAERHWPEPAGLVFSLDDPRIADHRINGAAMLHAAVFLDLARAAGGLGQVRWLRPVEVPAEGVAADLARDGDLLTLTVGGAEVASARAVAASCPVERLDLAALRASATRSMGRDEAALPPGVHLGPTFAGVERLWLGEGWALGRVARSAAFVTLADAAIQTAVALAAQGDGAAPRLRMPVGVDRLAIAQAGVEGEGWVHVRLDGEVVNITVTDGAGVPVQAWTGFRLALVERGAEDPRPCTLRPVWEEAPAVLGPPAEPPAAWTTLDEAIAAARAGGRVLFTCPDANATLDAGPMALFRLVRALLAAGLGATPLEVTVVARRAHGVVAEDREINPVGAATLGLAKAMAAEVPAWTIRCFDVDDHADSAAAVLRTPASATGEPVALRGGRRFELRLLPLAPVADAAPLAGQGWLLVGGAGRIGRVTARFLADAGARVVLVGRSDAAERHAFATSVGGHYRAADMRNSAAARAVVAEARELLGGCIDGVIQAVVDPAFAPLVAVDEAEFAAALAAKADTLANLWAALADDPPGRVVVFSSIGAFAGFPGNAGQTSYAAGCGFEAAFAATLPGAQVVHWGLWQDESWRPDLVEATRRQGLFPMAHPAALAGLAHILASGAPAVLHASLSDGVWTAMGAAPDLGAVGAGLAAVPPADANRAADAAVDAYARWLAADRLRDGMPAPLPRLKPLAEAVRDLVARAPAGEGADLRAAVVALGETAGPVLDLLETCVAALPAVLSGEVPATDVLFPGGAMHRVEAIYRDQPVLSWCNRAVAEAVAALAAERPISVIEVGAGTGATAAAVLALLGERGLGGRVRYVYTDVSAAFVRHGRTRFGGAEADYQVLDIDQPPGAQGLPEGTFDLVLATNVLHATADVGRALAHVAALLRPGGAALVNEMIRPSDFATLTFGLLDGWWAAQDAAVRMPGGPLLDAPRWAVAFKRAGLRMAAVVRPSDGAPQGVLAAVRFGQAPVSAPRPVARKAVVAVKGGAALEAVRRHVCAALDLPPERLDDDRPFAEIGVDSIVSPMIAEALNRDLGTALRSTDLFSHASIAALAAHLTTAFPEAFAAPAAVPVPVAPVSTAAADTRIAIVGMAGRFPGAPDLETYWDNLVAGRSAITEIDRFVVPDDLPAKRAGLVPGHDLFDPLFFNISPVEAEAMDPQQRLLLEEAWKAIEDAGMTPAALAEQRCGVFVGASANSYVAPVAPSLQTLGGSMAILSARLSYLLDLRGPAFPIDTGCSSSLVAVHLACRSLMAGDCRAALAAGVSVNLLSPTILGYLVDAGMASPNGRCAAFDASADGFVPGEGVGVVVLKRLADAQADGDRIHAVLLGTGINQDGRTSGMTAPNGAAQTALELEVWRQGGVDAASIGMVEAHGTGTPLGDPIEVQALTDAFRTQTDGRGFCALGSAKTNIGHAMAASGMAGLLKAVLAVGRGVIPPSLNYVTPNPRLDLATSPFRIPLAAEPWSGPRRATVSSFGFSGTNGHVLLEGPPSAVEFTPAPAGPWPFVLSAKTPEALARKRADLAEFLRTRDVDLADLAHTLAVRRAAMRERFAVVAGDVKALIRGLENGGPVAGPAADWLAGATVDWAPVFGGPRPVVSLPAYPFARERYWNPVEAPEEPAGLNLPANHWLVREHRVAGRCLLPGAAMLEALRDAAGPDATALCDVTWIAPVVPGEEPVRLRISRDGDVLTLSGPAGDHARARAVQGPWTGPDRLDIAALRAGFGGWRDGAELYRDMAAAGLDYGEGFRVISTIAADGDRALARIDGPLRGLSVLLDGAMQVAAGIGFARAGEGGAVHIPFGLGEWAWRAAPVAPLWVHAEARALGEGGFAFTITVADEGGVVVAVLRDLIARPAGRPAEVLTLVPEPRPAAAEARVGTLLALLPSGGTPPDSAGRVIVAELGEGFRRTGPDRFVCSPEHVADLLAEVGPVDRVVHAWAMAAPPDDGTLPLANALDALRLPESLRTLFALSGAAGPVTVVAPQGAPVSAALGALGKALAAEDSRLSVQGPQDLVLRPVDLPAAAPLLRRGGTYVITGGQGGIGRLLARFMAGQWAARLVLVGRGAPDGAFLADLERLGGEPFHVTADVADTAALRAGLTRARALFGPIEGVFHAAGTRDDGLARDRTWESVEAVLAPKVRGTVVLDRLTRADPLAFFVCFSSTAGVLGPIGQAGYAAANGFLDGFAEARQGPGRSLAVGWPLWAEGGMRPPAEVWDDIRRTTGLEPLPTNTALDVLWAALASDLRRVTVLYGDRARLTRWLDQPVTPREAAAPTGQGALEFMAKALAEVAKLPVERFDPDVPLESYGIDSMMIVRLNAVLERDLGETSKTLFFEHRTARGLAERLAERHPAAFGPPVAVAAPVVVPQVRERSADIAIIGLAGQFPGAADLDAFWSVLDEGRDCITEIPADRWPLAGFYDPDRDNPRTSYSKWGGFIDGVDQFDPRFFGLSPVEAESLDPNIRKFMEAAWWALEDAGLGREQAFGGDPRRRGGVFAGVMHGDYQLFGAAEAARGKLAITTSAYWNIANRVSHFLDFRGPSLAVDSACSASLTALHLACQSLRAGECAIALAGGVNVSIHPNKYWTLSKAGFASSDGRCRSFGAGGDGYVPGEGVGCAVLKPLDAALADGDRIHAVIRGSAINHGGRTSGYTVPNPVAQGDLIAEALERAATPPETISYVEAHGTGTALGDPVEIAGLRRAFAGLPAGSLPIGSVKSNVGHLEAAAGIAAVAKVVLQMRHRRLVPSLHADPPNPGLDLAGSPFVVQGASAPWSGRPLRAGISSFGAGGANAHLVIEEAPQRALAPASGGPRVLTLSAAAPESLRAMAGRLAAHLRATDQPLHDIARTLQSRREVFRHRLAVVADTAAEAARRLDLWLADEAVALGSGPHDAAARAWMDGEAVDWAALCPDPWQVVSLPPYPFALRRCWYQTVTPDPLVDGRFGADDGWLVDHQVAGRPVLAGAVQVAFALGALEAPVALSGVVWRRAVAAGEGVTLTVDGATVSADGDPCLTAEPAPAEPPPEAPDLAAVRARCPRVVPGAEALAALASAGAVYGPRFQALERVSIGDGEALADLRPAARQPVDPGQLDAVLQAAFAVLPDDLAGPLLPAAVDRLTWWRSPEGAAVAWLRRRSSDRHGMVLDVVVSDGAGVCAALDGLVLRRPADPLPPLRVLVEAWEPVAVEAPTGGPLLVVGDGPWLADAAHRLPLDAPDDAVRAVLPKVAEVVFLGGFRPDAGAVRHATVAADEETVVRPLFRLLRLLAAEGWPVALRVVTCGAQRVAAERLDPWAAAVTALAKTAAHEHPEAKLRLIDLDSPDAAALASCAAPSDAELAWRDGRMLVKRLGEADPAGRSFTPGGVAVIAGAGGIGLTLARHLALRHGMAVALIGRKALGGDRLRRVAEITAAGGRVLAVQADLADPAAVAEAVRRIRADLGPVRLAVHAAMVLDDAPLVAQDWDRFRAVLRPKTLGLAGFVEALADQPPETLLLFSSANAHTANRGQAAYAAASAFEDAYGRALDGMQVRIIDWGLWGESGRMADPAALAGLSRMGVHPLSDAEGLDLAERAITGALPRLLPMRARPDILAAMGWRPAGPRAAIAASVAAEQARAVIPDTIDGEAVNALARERVALEVLDLGLLVPGEAVDPAILGARLEDRGGYRRLVGALTDILARHGVLEPADGAWRVSAEAFDRPLAERRAALARRRQALEDAQPGVAPYFALLEACVTRLPDVVAGRLKAVDVLFPGGSTALVDPIYRGNPVADHLQRLVAVAVVEAARAVTGRVPRILEVGAGTGGTTAFVLPALAEAGLEAQYCFTDVGRMFLDQARQRFADHPGLSFQVFDVERPGAPQGLGAFDIIIAANVIHATRDIAVSLGTLRALCAPGAVLVLNEANSVQDINTLTFGLTPGWWLFNDDAVRLPHGPVLSVAGWRRVLGRAGFGDVLAASLPGAVDEDAFLQSILVAEADPAWVAPAVVTEDRPKTATAGGDLEAVVRREVAAALHMAEDEVDPDASFAEFGADSIISIELVRRLNAALNIELKSTALFNHSTVRALAAAIADEYGGAAKTKETGADRLRRLIARRDQAAPVNREREFLAREAGDGAVDLQTLLQRLESGEVDLETALETEVME